MSNPVNRAMIRLNTPGHPGTMPSIPIMTLNIILNQMGIEFPDALVATQTEPEPGVHRILITATWMMPPEFAQQFLEQVEQRCLSAAGIAEDHRRFWRTSITAAHDPETWKPMPEVVNCVISFGYEQYTEMHTTEEDK